MTPKEPDQIVKIDLSSLPEERFPAVVWLYQRRTFAWKTTGGFLPRVAEASAPPRGETKLAKVKRNEAIPHVIPLLFTGPKATPGSGVSNGIDPAAHVAGGMADGLLRDALAKEAGGIGNLTQNIAPGGSAPSGDGTGGVSNVTYVYISSPPHTPSMDTSFGGGGSSAASPPGGLYYQSSGGPPAMFMPGYPMSPQGTYDPSSGTTYGRTGAVSYDPRTGATSSANGNSSGGNLGYNVGGVVVPVRQTRGTGP